MGFLNKLKSAKNLMTGGGAKVTLEAPEPTLCAPFEVVVRASIADADVKVSRVYLRVRSVEEVRLPDVPVPVEEMIDGERRIVGTERREYSDKATLYSADYDIGEAETLEAGSERAWDALIELPEDALPTYHGHRASHQWQFYAGLDARGNDPDSGWVTVEIWQ